MLKQNLTKYLPNIFLLIVFSWISFFPYPIMEEFHLLANIILVFFALLFIKGIHVSIKHDLFIWIFLFSIGVSVLFSTNMNASLIAYVNLTVPLLLIYYIISSVDFEINFNFFIKFVSLCSILVALIGICDSFFGFNPLYEYFLKNPYYERFVKGFVRIAYSEYSPGFFTVFSQPISLQYHPTPLGTYLLGCLPFNLILLRQKKVAAIALGAVGTICGITTLILTFSRSILLGMIVVICIYFVNKKRFVSLIVFIIIMVSFIFICTFCSAPFNRYGISMCAAKGEGVLAPYRSTRFIMVTEMTKEHPFVGLGLKQFKSKFCDYFPAKCEITEEFKTADNMYLTLLAETGIIGFVGLMLLILRLLLNQYKLAKEKIQGQIKDIAEASFLALIGILICMLGYDLFYWPGQYMFFCLIVGLLGIQEKERA